MWSEKSSNLENVLRRNENLILKDGIKLSSTLWIPDEQGKWPALLVRQPYGKEIASTITSPHPSWLASHGFLVVVQDVRGQGSSEGDFYGFNQEYSDTSQTHTWVRELPECNGLLGTYGFSYQGLTQLLSLPGSKPPDCLIPSMTGLNEEEHWSCEGGAFWWHIGLSWGLQLAALKAKRNGEHKQWHEIRKSLEDRSYLREGADLLEKYDPQGMAINWLNSSQQNSKNWKVHKPLKTWLKKPMLLIGGWWDPHLFGILDIYQKSLEAGGNPDLHIGPATHLKWWEGSEKLLLDFLKLHLQSPNNSSIEKPKKQLWNLTTSKWDDLQSLQTISTEWGFKSSGIASINSNDGKLKPFYSGSGIETIVHDPWRPIPSIGGHLSPEPGEADRTEIDKRFDVATFTTEPLLESIQIKGIPILEIEASSDQKSFDICLALSIVNKMRTKVTQLSTGILRIKDRNSIEYSTRKIKLQPLLAEFKKGTSLRISIAGSSWPAIGINPGDNKTQSGAPNPKCLVTTISLKLSKAKLSFSPLISK